MSVAVITGSAGLIGSEAAAYFGGLGLDVVGIDNNLREVFFGRKVCTTWNTRRLQAALGGVGTVTMTWMSAGTARARRSVRHSGHRCRACDPYRRAAVARLGGARTAHVTSGERHGHPELLEATRDFAPTPPSSSRRLIRCTATRPNCHPLMELDELWEMDPRSRVRAGIDEHMTIDGRLHSCSAPRRSRPMCRCKSMAGTSG